MANWNFVSDVFILSLHEFVANENKRVKFKRFVVVVVVIIIIIIIIIIILSHAVPYSRHE